MVSTITPSSIGLGHFGGRSRVACNLELVRIEMLAIVLNEFVNGVHAAGWVAVLALVVHTAVGEK